MVSSGFFADTEVTGEEVGSLHNLGLKGKLSFQVLQLGVLWEGEPGLTLRRCSAGRHLFFLPHPRPKGASLPFLPGATGTRNAAAPLPNPYPA